MYTPNIDSLAGRGVLFRNHYVSHPVCIPSRAALLTSIRCERTEQEFGPSMWLDLEGVETIGGVFDDAGYYTVSIGKIWHAQNNDVPENRKGFDETWKDPNSADFADPSHKNVTDKKKLPAAEGPLDVEDDAYGDGLIAAKCIEYLGKAAKKNKPFLIMCGFKKPHLPFNAPKKYWDLYDPDNPPGMPVLETLPEGGNENQLRTNHELWNYEDGFRFNRPPSGNDAKRLRQAYAACISYVDAQIGKVMSELERLRLADNTVIVFWSDHGYQLGHLGSWTKGTNMEMTAGAPLIISAPGFANTNGSRSTKVVESVDIFPTLVDLCGLDPLQLTDGVTLRPLLEDPANPAWNNPAWHVVKRGGPGCGRAIRDERYRYIEWRKDWRRNSNLLGTELYDYEVHPEERINVVDDPAYADEVARLSGLLWNWENPDLPDPPVKDPPSLVLHLDSTAANGSSIEGSVMTTWNDMSTFKNHVQAQHGTPIYPSQEAFPSGLKGVGFSNERTSFKLFDADDSALWLDQSDNGKGFAIFLSFKRIGSKSPQDLFGNSSGGKGLCIKLTSGGGGAPRVHLGNLKLTQANSLPVGQSTIIAINYDAATGAVQFWDAYNDTLLNANISADNFTTAYPVRVGTTTNSSRFAQGVIGEVKIYNAALSTSDFAEEQAAWLGKWIGDGYDNYWWPELGMDIGGPEDDFDQDGILNLVEYALGGNPMRPDSALAMSVEEVESALRFKHFRRLGDPTLQYTILASPDLSQGSWSPLTLTELGANNFDTYYEEVIYALPEVEERIFIKVDIDQQ